MNKRQRKKNWSKHLSENRRMGCEQCGSISARFMTSSDDSGWTLLTLKTYKDKNKWKLELRQKEEMTSSK